MRKQMRSKPVAIYNTAEDQYHSRIKADLTSEVSSALDVLLKAGFSVCAFTPTELRGADPEIVAEEMTRMGWDAIDMFATEPHPKGDI